MYSHSEVVGFFLVAVHTFACFCLSLTMNTTAQQHQQGERDHNTCITKMLINKCLSDTNYGLSTH